MICYVETGMNKITSVITEMLQKEKRKIGALIFFKIHQTTFLFPNWIYGQLTRMKCKRNHTHVT